MMILSEEQAVRNTRNESSKSPTEEDYAFKKCLVKPPLVIPQHILSFKKFTMKHSREI